MPELPYSNIFDFVVGDSTPPLLRRLITPLIYQPKMLLVRLRLYKIFVELLHVIVDPANDFWGKSVVFPNVIEVSLPRQKLCLKKQKKPLFFQNFLFATKAHIEFLV